LEVVIPFQWVLILLVVCRIAKSPELEAARHFPGELG
jgi:hypothetical protein